MHYLFEATLRWILLLQSVEIISIVLEMVIFWLHVGHLLSSHILLMLLLSKLDVILNFGHWLLQLAVHLLLDHAMYLLLLLIAENAILAMVHSVVLVLWNSHLLHRSSLRTSNFAATKGRSFKSFCKVAASCNCKKTAPFTATLCNRVRRHL